MKRMGIALGMVLVSAVLVLFIDAITASIFAFIGIVFIFISGLLVVGLTAEVKRNSRGTILW